MFGRPSVSLSLVLFLSWYVMLKHRVFVVSWSPTNHIEPHSRQRDDNQIEKHTPISSCSHRAPFSFFDAPTNHDNQNYIYLPHHLPNIPYSTKTTLNLKLKVKPLPRTSNGPNCACLSHFQGFLHSEMEMEGILLLLPLGCLLLFDWDRREVYVWFGVGVFVVRVYKEGVSRTALF